jgi:hypothetical protein
MTQNPNSEIFVKTPITRLGHWDFEFVIYLEFGAWVLVL